MIREEESTEKNLPNPQSANFAFPCTSKSTFSNFRSRCTTPCWWQYASAAISCEQIRFASFPFSLPFSLMCSSKSPLAVITKKAVRKDAAKILGVVLDEKKSLINETITATMDAMELGETDEEEDEEEVAQENAENKQEEEDDADIVIMDDSHDESDDDIGMVAGKSLGKSKSKGRKSVESSSDEDSDAGSGAAASSTPSKTSWSPMKPKMSSKVSSGFKPKRQDAGSAKKSSSSSGGSSGSATKSSSAKKSGSAKKARQLTLTGTGSLTSSLW